MGASVTPVLSSAAGVEQDWPDLAELGKIEVVSVNRRETSVDHTAAAISVITSTDIARSAAFSVPELLRQIPGVDVTHVGATAWGLGVRGFGSEQSNKLLVMQDNRSLYSPVFSGTIWSAENFFLQDIERIEVVRGPGGAAWGANAVNGVINVVNKPASETLGGLLSVMAGSQPALSVAARQGVLLEPDLAARVYVKSEDIRPSRTPAGGSAADGERNTRGGFRADWSPSSDRHLSLTGEYFDAHLDKQIQLPSLSSPTGYDLVDQPAAYRGFFVRSRLNCLTTSGAQFDSQLSVDKFRSDTGVFASEVFIVDFDSQYSTRVGPNQQWTGGVGYRFTHDDSEAGRSVSFTEPSASNTLISGFIQHEATLAPELLSSLVGVRVEHHKVAGWDVQPTFRLLCTPGPRQSLWLGASRAVRIPSRVPTQGVVAAKVLPAGVLGPYPTLVELRGDPNLKNEVLWSYELGYRIQPADTIGVELNVFHNEYKDLIEETLMPSQIHFVPTPAPAHYVFPSIYANSRDARSNGGELATTWRPASRWAVTGYCNYVDIVLSRKPAGAGMESDEGYTPKWSGGLRLKVDFAKDWLFSADLRRSGHRPSMVLPGYSEVDLKLIWKPSARLELSLVGQNLLHDQHAEAYPLTSSLRTREIQRSGYGQLTWLY